MEKHGYVIDAAKTKDYVEGSAENISCSPNTASNLKSCA